MQHNVLPQNIPSSTPTRIVAVIPCLNEERFIGSLVIKTSKFVDQVIVVDDGSTDQTSEIAEAAGALVLRHPFNQGKSGALNTAFQKIRDLGGATAVVVLDGDAQHKPEDITRVVQPVLSEGVDMVVGSRFLGRKNHVPFYRRAGQTVLTMATNLGSKVKISDSQSGFRAFSERAINALTFQQEGFSVESEMQFLMNEKGFKVSEVPIVATYNGKAKRSPIAHGVKVLGDVFSLISQSRPLLFFAFPGTLVLGGGIYVGAMVVRNLAVYGNFSIGYTMVSMLLCIVGLLSINTGILLNSISSILTRNNGKR